MALSTSHTSACLGRVKSFIQKHQLFSQEDPLLVAISGGPDSIFLAWCLYNLGYKISLAHVNYGLRGKDSEHEESLVWEYADKWRVQCFVRRVGEEEWAKKNKDSLQMLARKIRYDFFENCMEKTDISICATAHHADDQVENLLLSLAKGNSFSIFNPIPVQRGPYVRPLLGIYKNEILHELSKEGIEYSTDYTNKENIYQRNRIRNEVIPTFQKINPAFPQHILKRNEAFSRQMALLENLLEEQYQAYVEEGPGQNLLNLKSIKWGKYGAYADVILSYCLMKWGIHGHLYQEGLRLLYSASGARIEISVDQALYRTRDGILLEKKRVVETDSNWELREESQLPWERKLFDFTIRVTNSNSDRLEFEPGKFYLDSSKIFFPLTFRGWKVGDRMIPFGMKGSKRLSDIFVDEKYSPVDKKKAIVVESGGEIVALSGFRISEQVKVDFRTKNVLVVEFREN